MIDLNKKYTLGGNPAVYLTKLKTNSRHCNLFKVTLPTGTEVIEYVSDTGFNCYEECLIEDNPYKDFEIDDLVVAWYDPGTTFGNGKFKAYFAGVSNSGKPIVWSDGGTSCTRTIIQRTTVDNCIKAN